MTCPTIQPTRRQAILGTLALGLGLAATAKGAESEPATEQEPATLEDVLGTGFEGPIRLKVHVEGWVELQGFAFPREHQHFVMKGNGVAGERLHVLVGAKVFDRLAALGIADPKRHFVDKLVVVSGTVHRNDIAAPGGGRATSISLWVDEPGQVESITPVSR